MRQASRIEKTGSWFEYRGKEEWKLCEHEPLKVVDRREVWITHRTVCMFVDWSAHPAAIKLSKHLAFSDRTRSSNEDSKHPIVVVCQGSTYYAALIDRATWSRCISIRSLVKGNNKRKLRRNLPHLASLSFASLQVPLHVKCLLSHTCTNSSMPVKDTE